MRQIYTVSQVAKLTGVSEATLRQHIARGRLVAEKDGTRSIVTQASLDAYLAAGALSEAATEVRRPGADVPREIGNMLNRLPPHVAEAILAGVPTSKKAGSGEAFNRSIEQLPKRDVPEDAGDPHWGYPIGYQHLESPRWKRISETAWRIEDVTYSWNGFAWECSREGVEIGSDISPANPWSDRRPLAPAKRVTK